ncbi:MAG TPA: TOMM precursor leader peptide-binding protein, partial [Pseudonocardiaceae bacterium]|nr:TOMM precursor leader peptide-binding protein [Pseudonocardiaceae bacterium]
DPVALAAGGTLLFIGTWRYLVYIGPAWSPGRTGCPRCLLTRTVNSPFGPDRSGAHRPPSSPREAGAIAAGPGMLRQIELYARAAQAVAAADLTGSVLVMDASTGKLERQPLLPDSTCPVCALPGTDTLPAFTAPQVPLTKLAPATLRTARPDAEALRREYLFAGIGLFKQLRQDLQSPFGACSVELPSRWGAREPAIGRAPNYRDSRTIAVLEGLERYAGLHRGARVAAVRAPYAEVAARAVYPPALGTHPEESYRCEGFRYRPFHPDTEIDWVWAYSYRRRDRVLLPERAAYWGPRHDGEISFYHDTSNGCALGSSPEEAILHGLREVAERDSFLLTWYRRLALPEVIMDGDGCGRVAELLRRARLFTGFEFRCFLSTMEYGMPSVWLTAENTRSRGPAVFAGSGAHPDPVQAVAGGLYELVGIILATRHGFEQRRAEALRMLDDPRLIRRMPDHSLVGALPQARARFSFLLDAEHERIPLGQVPSTVRTGEADLRADLDAAIGGMLDAGLDVLAVDQTTSELRRNGLHCVRVVVPGLAPMTFGHLNRRTRNLPRLTEGTSLPYRDQLEPGEEVGCTPHPFP